MSHIFGNSHQLQNSRTTTPSHECSHFPTYMVHVQYGIMNLLQILNQVLYIVHVYTVSFN